jgi:hypothetical protein
MDGNKLLSYRVKSRLNHRAGIFVCKWRAFAQRRRAWHEARCLRASARSARSDQRARDLAGFYGGGRPIERVGKILNFAAIERRQMGMQS